jgi:uncharacterized membrane protein YcaP (DUF421 family)
MEQQIKITDLPRILIGEVPADFFVELLIRLLVAFFLALITMRLMGKRMAAQLSRNELTALVSVAAAIGVSIQAPDRGVLPSVVIALVIILSSRGTAWWSVKNSRFEQASQGKYSILVKDAVLQTHEMEKIRLSRERVFAQLRSKELKNLAEVKRLYMESGGKFSLIKQSARAGLSLIPEWDKELREEQEKAEDYQSCSNCGLTIERQKEKRPCSNCSKNQWETAIK